MIYDVFLIKESKEDIRNIYQFVSAYDSPAKAAKLVMKLHKTVNSLQHLPGRGHVPPELERINVMDFLEIHYKPYRLIYQVIESRVFVHCALDGRRELMDLLYRRLLQT